MLATQARQIGFAVDWCARAVRGDRITGFGIALLVLGLVAAWLGPFLLILNSGRFLALVYWPFMSLALTFFFVVPPYLFLMPRLVVWDGHIHVDGDGDQREVVMDFTKFKHPEDLTTAVVNKRAKWKGTACLLSNGAGPFLGRLATPVVSTQSYYRAKYKPALLQYAQQKVARWKDVELGFLALIILGSLVVGLLAISE